VLGLVRRDLLIEIAGAVAREDATAIFDLAARAVESGYDLRLVIRELARLTRDLLILSVDPSRVADPEIAAEAERQALLDLSRTFSGEDLMRAFDVLTKAEYDIRASMQPRYHLEMALLRWIHLRRLVPLTDLIQQVQSGAPARAAGPPASPKPATAGGGGKPASAGEGGPPRSATVRAVEERRAAAPAMKAAAPASADTPSLSAVDPSSLKESFLGEIRKSKKFFYGTVVAQAQKIEFEGDRAVFTFAPQHRTLRAQLEQNRAWLEAAASQLSGRKITIAAAEGPAAPGSTAAAASPESPVQAATAVDRQQALKERALSDTGVQTMLDVFAAEIKDIEEM